jgi:biopolymer transport protein ExbB
VSEEVQAFEIIFRGGPLMWPIMACSVVAFGIAIERFIVLRRAAISSREFLEAIRQVLRQGRVQDAVALCDEAEAPLARVVRAGLLKSGRAREEMREAMEDAGKIEVPRLERFLPGLATCASVAPLLGMLGTVQGLINCFAAIQFKQGLVNPSDLAGGIGNALVTTAAGLVVAIPTLVLYNYFVARVDSLTVQFEVSASEVLDLVAVDENDGGFGR